MEDIVSEIGKGFLRGIGYLLVEVLFNFILYYIGWPICKILSLGTYPKKVTHDYLYTDTRQGLLCSLVGFTFVLLVGLYLTGQFNINGSA